MNNQKNRILQRFQLEQPQNQELSYHRTNLFFENLKNRLRIYRSGINLGASSNNLLPRYLLFFLSKIPKESRQEILRLCLRYLILSSGNPLDAATPEEAEEREYAYDKGVKEIKHDLQKLMPVFTNSVDDLFEHLDEKVDPGSCPDHEDMSTLPRELKVLVNEAYQLYETQRQQITLSLGYEGM